MVSSGFRFNMSVCKLCLLSEMWHFVKYISLRMNIALINFSCVKFNLLDSRANMCATKRETNASLPNFGTTQLVRCFKLGQFSFPIHKSICVFGRISNTGTDCGPLKCWNYSFLTYFARVLYGQINNQTNMKKVSVKVWIVLSRGGTTLQRKTSCTRFRHMLYLPIKYDGTHLFRRKRNTIEKK